MAHTHGLLKEGAYPKGRPHMKGLFDRKTGKLIWGPGSQNPYRHKTTKVQFRFYVLDKKTGEYSNTWLFSPSFIKLV